MSRLISVDVKPYYAQVQMNDAEAEDYPQWETGKESVTSLPNSIAVATQDDLRGNVRIEVWRDRLEVPDEPKIKQIFDGEFRIASGRVVVGNTVGNALHPFSIEPGHYQVRIFKHPSRGRASKVYFLLSPIVK